MSCQFAEWYAYGFAGMIGWCVGGLTWCVYSWWWGFKEHDRKGH